MKAVFRILLVDTRFIDLELANSVQEALSRLCKGHDVRVVRAQNKCLELLCTASLASFFELQEVCATPLAFPAVLDYGSFPARASHCMPLAPPSTTTPWVRRRSTKLWN